MATLEIRARSKWQVNTEKAAGIIILLSTLLSRQKCAHQA